MSLKRSLREQPRAAFTVLLLVLALVLTALLAHQAQVAARSHRRTAEGALNDYASFATWQLMRQARTDVQATLMSAFIPSLLRLPHGDATQGRLDPEEVREGAMRRVAFCDCLDGVRFFFRLDVADSSLVTTADEVSPTVRGWVRDTILGHLRAIETPGKPVRTVYGSVEGGPRLGVVITNDSYITIFGEADGRPRALAYVMARDSLGLPVTAYGFESDPAAFAGPIFADIAARELLPPSLVRDLKTDSVLSIAVRDRAGTVVFRSGAGFPERYAVEDTLETRFGSLIVGVALRPEIAERLVVGGLPRSRLPVLIGLLLLTAGMVVAALMQLRRQQELARLRGDFVSSVSHELRTPLAQIRLFAELLHMGKLRGEEERRRSARIIDQEARRLAYLVENVLNFARSERRSNRLVLEPTEVEREIRDVLDTFSPLARPKAVTLQAELGEPVTTAADRAALHQMLLNLLDNAVKYGPAHQTVTVRTRRNHDRLRIEVEDEGPGIPEGEREQIFEPYRRLERDATAVAGSGIGLAVVRELATLHGGRVWVENIPVRGARFVIELPLTAAPPVAVPADEPNEPLPV